MKKKGIPPFIKLAGWLITLFAFAIGFWHTHLGLSEFKILSSEYGSLVLAAIILLIIIVSYYSAVNGKKSGFIFFLIGASFFFVFNLNSFYPTYLGRKLIKEEAIQINDSINKYSNKIDNIVGNSSAEYIQKLQEIEDAKTSVIREIKNRGGFGLNATKDLEKFNGLANSNISPDRNLGDTEEEINEKIVHYEGQLTEAINSYIIKSLSGKEQGAIKLIAARNDIKDISSYYLPLLEEIIKDNSEVIIDSIRYNPQINTLQEVVNKLDKVATKVNSVKKPKVFTLFHENNKNIKPETQNLGTFAHTINSVKKRISKTDTIGIIALCLFIDFITPLAIYFLIKRREDDEDDSTFNLWNKIPGKKQPQKF